MVLKKYKAMAFQKTKLIALNFCNQRINTCLHISAVAKEFKNKIVVIKTQMRTDLSIAKNVSTNRKVAGER